MAINFDMSIIDFVLILLKLESGLMIRYIILPTSINYLDDIFLQLMVLWIIDSMAFDPYYWYRLSIIW